VVRTAPDVPLEERAIELPPPTAPLHRWVSCDGEAHAVTVVSDGLAEYEVQPGRVLVTLVRAVGELSRPDLPERPGNAGWPAPTPEAQCLGPFEATFALAAHPTWSDTTADAVEALADDVLLPLTGHTLRSAVRGPRAVGGVTLEGTGLAFGAMMPDDASGAVVLRCVNVTESARDAAWRVAAPLAEAWSARLDGTPLGRLPIEWEEGVAVVRLRVPPRGVSTVLVRPASG
jgi:alpha-mannosidase